MFKFYLTFDVEDFISKNAIPALHTLLEGMNNLDLKGLFFITAHKAEKLQDYPSTVDLLNEHIIGYHSSGHTVHPTIPEFTDLENYQEARVVSLERETRHINPLTGEMEGRGGILALRNLFPRKKINSFRAPGMCWSPPHLEAQRSLGIEHDFSTNVSSVPVSYKGITFFPPFFLGHWEGRRSDYTIILRHLLRSMHLVMCMHPSFIVNSTAWDMAYCGGSNPNKFIQPVARRPEEAKFLFNKWNYLLKQVKSLQRLGLLEATPNLQQSNRNLTKTIMDVENWYRTSMNWTTTIDHHPKFIHDHFFRFFEVGKSAIDKNKTADCAVNCESA